MIKEALTRLGNIFAKPAPPVLIYQPGKVGSLTIQASLEHAWRKSNLRPQIHHVHALNYLNERENFVKSTRKNPADSLNLIAEWKVLRKEIDSNPEKKWNIINLVRDPVAMKVSALFHLLYQHIPDWEIRLKNGTLDMKEIEELFFSKKEFGFSGLDTWYDKQIRDIWGLDIFSQPFNRAEGYQIYEKKNIRLMIIRLEDLNRVAARAFHDFLNIENFEVINANVGEEKSYAALYSEFKKRPLPQEYLQAGYQTKFANYFYSPEEIKEFKKKWS